MIYRLVQLTRILRSPLLLLKKVQLQEVIYRLQALVNAGNVQIDSLIVNNGMDLLIRRLEDQSSISLDSPLYDMQAQGRLKNLVDQLRSQKFTYFDNSDASHGHSLNIASPRKNVDLLFNPIICRSDFDGF